MIKLLKKNRKKNKAIKKLGKKTESFLKVQTKGFHKGW